MVLRFLIISAGVLVAIIAAAIIWPEFVDVPSLILTLGGSIAVTFFSYSKAQLRALIQAVGALFVESRLSVEDQMYELSRLTRLYQMEGLKGLETQEHLLADPFLRRGIGLLIDLHNSDKIQATLQNEIATAASRHEISRQILMTLGKLLPSFGLIGTLLGMVMLLKNLSGQDTQSLPAALGLAVLTTLYGAVLANVVVAPLAARLHSVSVEKDLHMRLITDWIMMICRGEARTAIANKLGVVLPPSNNRLNRRQYWSPVALSS
jgi:chemotaxis protein MotA